MKTFTDKYPEIYKYKNNYYYKKNKKLVSNKTVEKMLKLGIPPAYKTLWFCKDPKSNIQAIALDSKGRKQYYYNNKWKEVQTEKKYKRMKKFMEKLPKFWRINNINMKYTDVSKKYYKKKTIAYMFKIIKLTNIRVGNLCYEGIGLTTLKKENVQFHENFILLVFKGKSGVNHKIKIKDKTVIDFLKVLYKIPGEWLFRYKSSDGVYYRITSDHMNKYLQYIIGKEFTCKDFRTHASNKIFLKFIQKCDDKNAINLALEYTANKLGHNKYTSRNSYINEKLIEMYKKTPEKIKNGDIDFILNKVYN